MAASKNDFRNVSLQNLVDNPDCTEDDVSQWVQDNEELFVDESNPDEFSQDKVNKLFADLLNNNAVGGFGNLGIENTLNVDWFNIFGAPEPEEKEEPEQGWNITDAVLTMGKKILGMPGSAPAKKPVQKSSGGFGMGKIDLGTLLKYAGNSKLRKVYWVLKRVYNEIAKLWPSKRRRTTRRKTTAKKTASRSRTTTAKKTTTSRSTTAKKTPARTTAAKKTTAKKTTTRSTTAKKTR
ncbi:MAG: hypothetical protein IJH67_08855 [Thermoguttaceae bacterium]|nr:hypothetical protein [Thermoguttaceae bacterium]